MTSIPVNFAQVRSSQDRTTLDLEEVAATLATARFVLRVPYAIIKRMGRWRSDAFLVYYRDEEDVNRAVARGFHRLALRLRR